MKAFLQTLFLRLYFRSISSGNWINNLARTLLKEAKICEVLIYFKSAQTCKLIGAALMGSELCTALSELLRSFWRVNFVDLTFLQAITNRSAEYMSKGSY
jgi:hypothetical protein